MKKLCIRAFLLLGIIFLCFSIYLYYYNDNHISILGYHGILPKNLNTTKDEFILNLETFEKELKFLKQNHYETLSLDEFLCWKNKTCKKPHKAIVITFDDGYQNNYKYAFPLLKKYNMKATVFYIGSKALDSSGNYLSIDTIKKAKKEYPNITFASHSYNLHNHNQKSYSIITNDIKKMNKIINTKYFAYPHGEYNKEYIKALKDYNFKLAFTFGPKKEHRKATRNDNNYKIPRLNISSYMSFTKFKLRLFLPI